MLFDFFCVCVACVGVAVANTCARSAGNASKSLFSDADRTQLRWSISEWYAFSTNARLKLLLVIICCSVCWTLTLVLLSLRLSLVSIDLFAAVMDACADACAVDADSVAL